MPDSEPKQAGAVIDVSDRKQAVEDEEDLVGTTVEDDDDEDEEDDAEAMVEDDEVEDEDAPADLLRSGPDQGDFGNSGFPDTLVAARSSDDLAETLPPEWEYGWDRVAWQAYRARPGLPLTKDWALPDLTCFDDDMEPPEAIFPNVCI